MLQKFFRPVERALIADHHEEWRGLKGVKKELVDGEIVCPKSRLITKVVAEMLKKFPERDLKHGAHGPLVWSQEDRDTLWERTRQVFYNLDKTYARKPNESIPKSKTSKSPSFLTLFKRHFATEIKSLKEQLVKEGAFNEPMAAYNHAVKVLLEEKRKGDVETLEHLTAVAEEVKASLKAPPEDQTEEIRNAVLDVLPSEIIKTVRGWEARTNARIYVMGVWKNSAHELVKFDYASPSCKGYVKSATGKQIFGQWIEYMRGVEDHKANEPEEPKAAIYPDENGWPTFPRTDIIPVTKDEERTLFRRYFHLTSMASGGTTPPWTRMERNKSETVYVLPQRLPAGMPHLGNIRDWKRSDMSLMRNHLLAGQAGRLAPEEQFAWSLAPTRDGVESMRLSQPLKRPVLGVNLAWTNAEIRYGIWVTQKQQAKRATTKTEGAQLPPARTTHIYSPFNLSVFEDLEDLHSNDNAFFDLIVNTAKIERLGPIHCATDLNTVTGHNNPHVPSAKRLNLIDSDEINKWFTNEFFDTSENAQSPWALGLFHDWLKLFPFVHAGTKTVYGGPYGIRVIVLALSRIKRVLDWISKKVDVPARVKKLMRGTSPIFELNKAFNLWQECANIVSRQVKHSIDLLARSFDARAAEFEERVLELCNHSGVGEEHDEGVSATSGVPKNGLTLAAMAMAIRRSRQDVKEQYEEEEISMIAADRTIVEDIADEGETLQNPFSVLGV